MSELVKKDCFPGLVSVIVPCYNRVGLIETTLDSILNQSYRPIEVIIVDDGSTDQTIQVVNAWASKITGKADPKFLVHIVGQENGGPSKARNAGLMKSTGEFINFVDSDDALHPEKIDVQVGELRTTGMDFCVCNYTRFSDSVGDSEFKVDFFARNHELDEFPITYPMNTPTPLYTRKALLKTGGWNESIFSGEDFEYNFRLLCRGAKGTWIDKSLMFVRVHDGEERIQASPLRNRYRYMLQGLVEMEMEAQERGCYTKKLRKNLGIRSLTYAEHMRRENDAELAVVFRQFASSRVPGLQMLVFYFTERVWKPAWKHVFPGGPRKLLKQIVGGFK